MKESVLLQGLEEIAEKLQLKVSYENLRKHHLFSRGGLYRFRETRTILIDKEATLSEKIDIIADVLAQHDLEDIYMPPAVRKILTAKLDRQSEANLSDSPNLSSLRDAPQPNDGKRTTD